MKDIEKTGFSTSLIKVGQYYGRMVSGDLAEIYWDALKDFELEDIKRALVVHYRQVEEGRFFPKIADLIRLLEGSPESRSLIAWTCVDSTMGRVGRYQSLIFDDRLIHAVVEDMGGWIKLCEQPLKDLSFIAADFQKRYRAYIGRLPLRHPRYLVGILELENAARGYPVAPPMMLGNALLAEEVFKDGGGTHLIAQEASSRVRALIEEVRAVEKNLDKPKKD
ncbi:MAG: hypothetical protein KBD23_02105 [Gammaproteobacteria bacterium]|nr:hypothetical protein [Gammaproteobacteria bacterium]